MIESAYLLKQRRRRDSSVNFENGFKFLHSWQPELKGIDVWKFNEEDIKCITDVWLKDKPKWMLATPLIYSKYAEYILNNGINVFEENDLSFLEYTSQYMHQEEKEKIKRVFHCPLVSSFGSRECWNMAYECSEGNLHVNNEYLLVDIVDENGKVIIDSEKEGNVIITHLANIHMPLIKYIFDDRAKKKRVKLGVKGVEFTGGGEPLTHPECVEIITYAVEKGFDVGLVTNGFLLHKLDGIIDRMTFVRVSLDAGTAETYNMVHGVDFFDVVMSNSNFALE